MDKHLSYISGDLSFPFMLKEQWIVECGWKLGRGRRGQGGIWLDVQAEDNL